MRIAVIAVSIQLYERTILVVEGAKDAFTTISLMPTDSLSTEGTNTSFAPIEYAVRR